MRRFVIWVFSWHADCLALVDPFAYGAALGGELGNPVWRLVHHRSGSEDELIALTVGDGDAQQLESLV